MAPGLAHKASRVYPARHSCSVCQSLRLPQRRGRYRHGRGGRGGNKARMWRLDPEAEKVPSGVGAFSIHPSTATSWSPMPRFATRSCGLLPSSAAGLEIDLFGSQAGLVTPAIWFLSTALSDI